VLFTWLSLRAGCAVNGIAVHLMPAPEPARTAGRAGS